MTANIDAQDIIEGAVAGVMSGLVLSLFFWGKAAVGTHLERREQVRYLARLIADFRSHIYSSVAIDHTAAGRPLTRDAVRKAYYDDLWRQVDSALRHRLVRLSYDEAQEVRNAFPPKEYSAVVLNDRGYDSLFGQLEAIPWLPLPPRCQGDRGGRDAR